MSRPLYAMLWMCVGGLIAIGAIWAQDAQARWVSGPATTPTFHYQGRLINPSTGAPRVDGAYPMQFSLYTEEAGGAAVWTETKDVQVVDGVFSTMLGDATPLDMAYFTGQDLWLGITVGTDPQMTPRQPLAHVPYAIYAQNASHFAGQPPSAYALSEHSHSTLPTAYGTIREDGTVFNGAYGIENVVWNSVNKYYEITITDESYFLSKPALVNILGDTGSCPAGTVARFGSVNGKLLVFIVQADGTKRQCAFSFVTYGSQP